VNGDRSLDAEAVLWVAAIDRVPIEERVEWVKKMLAQINAVRNDPMAGLPPDLRLRAPSIFVRWNHDAANKKIAFVHVECEGERYTVEIEYRPAVGMRRWKIGNRWRWMVTDG
jgi:hypothetical protein